MRHLGKAIYGPLAFIVSLLLCISSTSLATTMPSPFEYLELYHQVETDADKAALIEQASKAHGDKSLRLAIDMRHTGPFPADFSEAVIDDFIDRFQAFVPKDHGFLETVTEEEPMPAQVIMQMAGIGYGDLFSEGLLSYVQEDPNALVQRWLEEDLSAWGDAMPYLEQNESSVNVGIKIPDTFVDVRPWRIAMEPDDAITAQTIYIGRNVHDGTAYHELSLDMMSMLPQPNRPTEPFRAMYAIVIQHTETSVGTYTNDKGAYRQDYEAAIYDINTGEPLWTQTFTGRAPSAIIASDAEGKGRLPDRNETYRQVVDAFCSEILR